MLRSRNDGGFIFPARRTLDTSIAFHYQSKLIDTSTHLEIGAGYVYIHKYVHTYIYIHIIYSM